MRRKILSFISLILVGYLCLGNINYADCSEIGLSYCRQPQDITSQLSPSVLIESGSLKNAFPSGIEDRNLLPVYDHYRKQIGLKPRSKIHTEGDLHHGVQAYVVRETENGTIQVLRQKRSDKVDIAKGKYDQSVATQELPQDNGNAQNTLKRGLFEELGISEDEVEIKMIGAEGWLRVFKKYSEDADLYNREFISLYLVKLKTSREIKLDNPKIEELEWVNWGDYIKDVLANRKLYTKTGSFYVLDPLMRDQTEEALTFFLKGAEVSAFPVRRVGFYSYDDNYDISAYLNWENKPTINIFDNKTGIMTSFKDIISFNIIEGKDVEHVKIVLITKNWNMAVWENGQTTSLGKRGDENSLRYVETAMERFNDIIREMESSGLSQSEKAIVEDTRLRVMHTLNFLRAKVLTGILRFPDWLVDTQDQFKVKGTPLSGDIEVLSLVGTFDPPHFAHIDRLLHALSYGVQAERTIPKTTLSFLSPVGENAPAPETTGVWKQQKTKAVLRHEMSKMMTDIFSPLVQTSGMSLQYPDSYGTENALRLIESVQELQIPGSGTITFTLVCGSDTFVNWQNNFDALFLAFMLKNPQIKLRIIVFNNPDEKFGVSALPRSKVPITFFSELMPLNDYSTGYHSSLFRMENNFNLLPVPLQAYIKEKKLYEPQGIERTDFNGLNIIREAVGASI